jgi:hypothetical protein
MSSINGIYGNSFNVSQVSPYNPASQTGPINGSSQASGNPTQGNAFVSAIEQALAQLGISPATPNKANGSSASNSAQDPGQALAAFMHDLFAAMQGQGAASATASTDSDGDSSVTAAIGAASASTPAVSGMSGQHHHHGGGAGAIEAKLQNLIAQLSSSGTGTASGTASSPAISTLQQDFQNLLTSSGASGNQTSLASFLQSLSQNLQGSNPGLNVSTSA